MALGFSITRISIIESLEAHEPRTGVSIAEYVRAQLADRGIPLPVEVLTCNNVVDFGNLMARLTQDAQTLGHIPLLHIECHGDQAQGLELENGSVVPWPQLSGLLLQLNLATRFNLFTVISACSGGYFLSEIRPGDPAPCLGMLAPTDTVDPAQILSGFRLFYADFVRTFDAGKAAVAMAKQPLSVGKWFGQAAEDWYERVVVGYVRDHCTRKKMEARARSLYRKLLADGKRQSIGLLKRSLRKANQAGLADKYFEAFFQTAEIPENATRFDPVRQRVRARIERLLSQPSHRL